MLDLGVPIEQVNYLAGHKSMAMTKRYGGAIQALDEAGKTGSAEGFGGGEVKAEVGLRRPCRACCSASTSGPHTSGRTGAIIAALYEFAPQEEGEGRRDR